MEGTVILAAVNIIFWLIAFIMLYKVAGKQQSLQNEVNILEQLITDAVEQE